MVRRMGGGFCFVKTVSASEGSPVEGSHSKIHATEHENPLMGSGLSLIPASHTFEDIKIDPAAAREGPSIPCVLQQQALKTATHCAETPPVTTWPAPPSHTSAGEVRPLAWRVLAAYTG